MMDQKQQDTVADLRLAEEVGALRNSSLAVVAAGAVDLGEQEQLPWGPFQALVDLAVLVLVDIDQAGTDSTAAVAAVQAPLLFAVSFVYEPQYQ